MPRALVTCPETASLEEIDYEDHPLGRLVVACSAFSGCALHCSRVCAATLDRLDRSRTEVEIICASADNTGFRRLPRPRRTTARLR